MTACAQCNQPATVRIQWPTSQGPQEGLFCATHADQFWQMFKNTPSGQAATFSPIEKEQEQ